jgi:hypothetical protein
MSDTESDTEINLGDTIEQPGGDEIVIRKMPTRDEIKGLNIDPRIPQPNFRLIMVAPSYTGKSNLILNLLIDHYAEGMQVYIFSKSFGNDSIWDNIEISDEFVFDSFDEPAINNILKKQAKLKQKFKDDLKRVPKLLFIIDDMINDIIDSKSDIITKLFFRGRHFVLSTILTSQAYTAIPSKIRVNGSDMVFFQQSSAREVKTIAEENGFGGLNQKEFTKLFVHATTVEDFSFLYINRRAPLGSKFRRKFDTIINVEGENVVEQKINERLHKSGKVVIEEDKPEEKEEKMEMVPINAKTTKRREKKKKSRKQKRLEAENAVLDSIIRRNKRMASIMFGGQ